MYVYLWSTHLCTLLDLRPTPRCSCDLPSASMLRGVGWRLVTDVSGQPIDPISKVKQPEKYIPEKRRPCVRCWLHYLIQLEYMVKKF